MKQNLPISFFLPTCILILSTVLLQAQVGIGNTDPAESSLLDIGDTNADKGVLIPRVSIEDLTTQAPITGTIEESLLVYNTNSTTEPGFFYWDGQWIKLNTGDEENIYNSNGTLTENRTIATDDYTLSFTNSNNRSLNLIPADPSNQDAPFIFQTGNSYSFNVDSKPSLRIIANGNVGIDTNTPSEKLEVEGNIQLTGTDNSNPSRNAGMLIYNNVNGLGGGRAKKVERLSRVEVTSPNTYYEIFDDPYVTLYCRKNINSNGTSELFIYLRPKQGSTGWWDYVTDTGGNDVFFPNTTDAYVISPNFASNYIGGVEVVINKEDDLGFPTYRLFPHLHSTIGDGLISVIVEAYYP